MKCHCLYLHVCLQPENDLADAEVDAFCGDEFVCQFDYKTTMQQSVASNTVNSLNVALQAKHDVMPRENFFIDSTHMQSKIYLYRDRVALSLQSMASVRTANHSMLISAA